MASQVLLWSMVLGNLVIPAIGRADVPAAVTYLQAQSQDAWITQALVAAGQTNVPTSHLTSVSGTLATDYAKAILAVVAAGQNPSTFGNTDYVAALKSLHANNQMGDASLLNDDFWSVIALSSVRQTSSVEAQDAKAFILAHQNADGGWGYAVSGTSDSNDTAAAVMALLEVGLTSSSAPITQALAYLQSVQNDDGGFGYDDASPSDSGSTAWAVAALNKLDVDPATWTKPNGNPLTLLQSLQDTDGGFWWMPVGTSDFNNKAMTAFAVVALADKTFPVAYRDADVPPAGTFHLRIEGGSATVCETDIAATTALNIVEAAASTCGYTFVIQQTAFGPYLSQINSEASQGLSGWLYFVDAVSPQVGAADYALEAGDEVLWYFGEWGWSPTRLTSPDTEVGVGTAAQLKAEYFNGTEWLPLPGATIKGGAQDYVANGNGEASVSLSAGSYEFFIQHPAYVRSDKLDVTVGNGVAREVDLTAEIIQDGGNVGGDSIIFVVTPSQLNFGQLRPGQQNQQVVSLRNEGTGSINVSANVTGENLFIEQLKIDSNPWLQFSAQIASNAAQQATVQLTVPANYLGSGIKRGELVFWAQGL